MLEYGLYFNVSLANALDHRWNLVSGKKSRVYSLQCKSEPVYSVV